MNFHKILGVSENNSLEEIKNAYRKKAKQLHPDLNSSLNAHEEFVELNKAYEYLKHLKTGKVYNHQYKKYKRPTSEPTRNYKEWSAKYGNDTKKNADKYANQKYEDYEASEFETSFIGFTAILEILEFCLVFSILIVIPLITYFLEIENGFVVSFLGIFMLSPYIVSFFKNSHKFNIKNIVIAIINMFKSTGFYILLIWAFNIYTFLFCALNTFVPLMTLTAFYAVFCTFTFLFYTKRFKPRNLKTAFFKTTGVGLFTINFFIFFNYSFTDKPKKKSISYYNYSSYLGINQPTSLVILKDREYDDYVGIRLFVDYRKISDPGIITYHIATGIFGIRVVKSYHIN